MPFLTSAGLSPRPLTSDAAFSAWARFADLVRPKPLEQRSGRPLDRGKHFALRRGMAGATGNVYVGLHEFMGMMLVLHLLRDRRSLPRRWRDVGSIRCLHQACLAPPLGRSEPDLEALQDLERNIEINQLASLVSVYPSALDRGRREVPMNSGTRRGDRGDTARSGNVRVVGRSTIARHVVGCSSLLINWMSRVMNRKYFGALKKDECTLLKVISQEGHALDADCSPAWNFSERASTMLPLAHGTTDKLAFSMAVDAWSARVLRQDGIVERDWRGQAYILRTTSLERLGLERTDEVTEAGSSSSHRSGSRRKYRRMTSAFPLDRSFLCRMT